MTKRPEIKGRGADVFFNGEDTPTFQPPQKPQPDIKPVKVTIYLDPELASQLDQAWLRRKVKDKNAQKSHVVSEALEPFLKKELAKSET